ncbi:MAG: restriction endonuclease subunit S, partial [Limosilactobacillus reuteri]|nr:restriction endonuclease subunit S [Limosilactobacillus reuteri]
AGSTFVEVSGKEMAKMPIKMPYYKEQQHISSFFSKLDFLITLHQRKLDKLKKMKAAYLEEMFV